jgi:uncharacterized membrane protein
VELRGPVVLRESHLRSLLKGISWRVLATATTIALAGAFIGAWRTAFAIGGAEFLIKLVFYYLHERAWQLAPPGSVVRVLVHQYRTDIAAPVYRESRLRSALKTVTWRIVATATTTAIAWGATSDLRVAGWIGGTEAVSKLILYYVHERAWQVVPRGTIRRVFARADSADARE